MHTYVTIRGTSAAIASSILAAATGGLHHGQFVLVSGFWQSGRRAYGTKIAEAVAPVSLMASATLAKTGLPRCSEPAFLGFVPPTTFVPVCSCQCLAFVVRTAVVVGAYRIRWLVVRGS
jgi:hypothetical protein